MYNDELEFILMERNIDVISNVVLIKKRHESNIETFRDIQASSYHIITMFNGVKQSNSVSVTLPNECEWNEIRNNKITNNIDIINISYKKLVYIIFKCSNIGTYSLTLNNNIIFDIEITQNGGYLIDDCTQKNINLHECLFNSNVIQSRNLLLSDNITETTPTPTYNVSNISTTIFYNTTSLINSTAITPSITGVFDLDNQIHIAQGIIIIIVGLLVICGGISLIYVYCLNPETMEEPNYANVPLTNMDNDDENDAVNNAGSPSILDP